MTHHPNPTTTEQTVTVDAPIADIYALLADLETIPEYWPNTTVRPTEEGVDVTGTIDIPGSTSSPSLPISVRVVDTDVPTDLTVALAGAIDGTIELELHPHDEKTRVTATFTYTLATPTFRKAVAESDWAGVEPQSAVVTTLTSALGEALTNLKQLWEQPSPPARLASGETSAIYCPFPTEISPHPEAVTAHTHDWPQQLGLIDASSTELATSAHFACRVHPWASHETLCLCSAWYSWLVLYNDALDTLDRGTGPERIERFQRPFIAVVEGEPLGYPQPPLVRAFADIWERACDRMPPFWQDRFAQHHHELFMETVWEAHDRNSDRMPDRSTDITNRRPTIEATLAFALVELASDQALPPTIAQREAITALHETANNIVTWTNDVYSFQPELLDDQVHNLVVVLRNERGCSFQQAMTEACTMITTETRRFEALTQMLPDDVAVDLDAYHEAVERWLAGNLAWANETTPYGHQP